MTSSASQRDDNTISKESKKSTGSVRVSTKSTASKASPASKRSTTSKTEQPPATPRRRKEENNWKTKAIRRLESDALAIIISFIIQAAFALFIMIEVVNTTGRTLIYLVGVLVLLLLSLFFTIEILIHATVPKLWLLVSGIYSAIAVLPAIAMLIISTNDSVELKEKPEKHKTAENVKEQMRLQLTQLTTAITIIVMVCHLLAIAHFYIKHYNFGQKKSEQLESGREKKKRTNAGLEQTAPVAQLFQDIVKQSTTTNKPPMSYMIDAELQPVD